MSGQNPKISRKAVHVKIAAHSLLFFLLPIEIPTSLVTNKRTSARNKKYLLLIILQ